MSDYDDSQGRGHSPAPSPARDSSTQNQRRAGNQFTQTSSGALPPRKTAPPPVVMRKADGTVAPPLPFTAIPADMAAWAFQPHIPMTAPQTPVQARGDIDGPFIHEAAAQGVSGSGSTLPHAERIQAAFGPDHDISHVRAHVGGAATVASEAIGAEAYATGHQIAFREAPDVHTAAHEAAHVVQQQRGVQLSGGVGQADDIYERHADAVADRVVAGQSVAELLTAGPTGGGDAAVGDIGTEATQAKPATSAVQRQADATEQADANTVDTPTGAEQDGLSPRARLILQRMNMQPALPPEAMMRLSHGLERLAEAIASYADDGMTADQIAVTIAEDGWHISFQVAVDAATGAIQLDLIFMNGESGCVGSLHIQPPQLDQGVIGKISIVDEPGEVAGETVPGPTAQEVAQLLFGPSAAQDLQLAVDDGHATSGADGDAGTNPTLAAELQQVESEIAAANDELLVLAADMAIDLAGIVDPTPISDGIALGRDLARGDYFGAALSGLSMLPWLGDAIAKPIKGVRIADKVNDVRKLLAKLQKRAAALRKRLNKPNIPAANMGKGPEVPGIKAPEIKAPEIKAPDPKAPNAKTPNAKADGAGPNSDKPEWLRRMEAGKDFDRARAGQYPHNEVYINKPDGSTGYYRLDSYNPRAREIVSRKSTQLSDIQESTAIRYINELPTKYPKGGEIANVPSNSTLLKGQSLQGRYVLEVPVQNAPIPQSVLDAADKAGVAIRDTNGKVY